MNSNFQPRRIIRRSANFRTPQARVSTDELDRLTNNEDYQQCLKSLFLTEPEDDYTAVYQSKGSRLEGTCEWIQHVDAYGEWLKTPGWQLCLLIGEPGAGKTFVATYLIDDLKKRSQQRDDVVFAYYFCDNKDEKRRSAQAILRSLLLQILRKRPEFYFAISSDFKTQGTQLFSSPNSVFALWRITNKILKSSTPSSFIFIIDAYDECDEESQETLLNLLLESFREASDTRDVKILITTRRTRGISRLQLQTLPYLKLLKIDNGCINLDLSRFIDFRVKLLEKSHYSYKTRCSIARTLKSRAFGTFIWVSLVLTELSKTVPSLADRVLDRMPEQLVELYDRILEQIKSEHAEIVKNILIWVIYARRPLTIKELAIAMRHSKESRTSDYITHCQADSLGHDLGDSSSSSEEDELEHTEFIAELELCPLIKFDEGVVYLIHQSAKDYLLDKGVSTGFLPAADLANFEIFQSCTNYLSLNIPASTKGLPTYKDYHMLRTGNFIKYCYIYWGEHARACESIAVSRTEWVGNVFLLDKSKRQTFFNTFWSYAMLSNGKRGMVTVLHILACLGLPKFIDVLLTPEELFRTLDCTDYDGETALHLAAANGHFDMVKLLTSKGSLLNTANRFLSTAIFEACRHGHLETAKILLEHGADPWKAQNFLFDSPLHVAIKFHHSPLIELILQQGCDLNDLGECYDDALKAAATAGEPKAIGIILDCGARVRAEHINACENNATLEVLLRRSKDRILLDCSLHQAMIRKLVMLGSADINQFLLEILRCGCQSILAHLTVALEAAARFLNPKALGFLLSSLEQVPGKLLNLEKILLAASSGPDRQSIRDGDLWSFHPTEACNAKYAEVVELLVSHGVNLNCCREDGQTSLSMAIHRLDTTSAHMLLQKGATLQKSDFETAEHWHEANLSRRGSKLMDLIILVNSMGFDLIPPVERAMMISICRDQKNNVQVLLCALACIHKLQLSTGNTIGDDKPPRIVSSEDGVPRTAIELDPGFKLDCSKVYVENVMFSSMIRVAIRLRGELNDFPPQEELRYTPPLIRIPKPFVERRVFKLLRDSAMGDPSHLKMDDDSMATLIYHVEDPTIARGLIQSGWASLPAIEISNRALYLAAESARYEDAEYFLSLGADPNSMYEGTTALCGACQGPAFMPSIVNLLIQKGADVNAFGGENGCPLGAAAAQPFRNAAIHVHILLQHGALVDGPQDGSPEYKTPLYYAAISDEEDVMRLLIQANANVNAMSTDGPLLISTYKWCHSSATVELLLDHGADCQLTNQMGQTLLHLAVEDGRADIVAMLLLAGADPNAVDQRGISPKDLAERCENSNIRKLFQGIGTSTTP